jgi:hypothetical protein
MSTASGVVPSDASIGAHAVDEHSELPILQRHSDVAFVQTPWSTIKPPLESLSTSQHGSAALHSELVVHFFEHEKLPALCRAHSEPDGQHADPVMHAVGQQLPPTQLSPEEHVPEGFEGLHAPTAHPVHAPYTLPSPLHVSVPLPPDGQVHGLVLPGVQTPVGHPVHEPNADPSALQVWTPLPVPAHAHSCVAPGVQACVGPLDELLHAEAVTTITAIRKRVMLYVPFESTKRLRIVYVERTINAFIVATGQDVAISE